MPNRSHMEDLVFFYNERYRIDAFVFKCIRSVYLRINRPGFPSLFSFLICDFDKRRFLKKKKNIKV